MDEEIDCCIGSDRIIPEISYDDSTLHLTDDQQAKGSNALSPGDHSSNAVVSLSKPDSVSATNSSDFNKPKCDIKFDPNQENQQIFQEHKVQQLKLSDEKELNLKQSEVGSSGICEEDKSLDSKVCYAFDDFDRGLSENQFLESKDELFGSEQERNLDSGIGELCKENEKFDLLLGSVIEDSNWGVSDAVQSQPLESKHKFLVESRVGLSSNSNTLVGRCTEVNDSGAKIEGTDERRCALKVEVTDEIAVIEPSVVGNRGGNGKGFVGSSERNANGKNLKQEAEEKKKERSQRKGKQQTFLKNGGEMVSTLRAKAEYGCEDIKDDEAKNKDMEVLKFSDRRKRKAYSRQELEALRYGDLEGQRKMWLEAYCGLGPVVTGEYDGLIASNNQKQNRVDFDPRWQGGRKAMSGSILGEECPGNTDIEIHLDPSSALGFSDAGDSTLVDGECGEDDDSDEDYSSIQRPAFLVTGEPDFDSGPPEDGLEYLRRVRWEAAQIPKVKVAKVDISKLKSEQTVYMLNIPEIAKCPEHLLPMKQWEDAFLADFSKLRLALTCHEDSSSLTSNGLQACTVHEEEFSHKPVEGIILNKTDGLMSGEIESSHFVDGLTMIESNALYPLAADQTDGLLDGENSTPKSTSEGESGSYPKLSMLLKMDSVSRVSMLKKWINSLEAMDAMSRDDCAWLFALCAAVDTPLHSDTSAALRSLLRKCASLRAKKLEMDDELIMLNILATISGRYFGQADN